VVIAAVDQRIDSEGRTVLMTVELREALQHVQREIVLRRQIVGEPPLRVLESEDVTGVGKGALENELQVALADARHPGAAFLAAERSFGHKARVGRAGRDPKVVLAPVAVACVYVENARGPVRKSYGKRTLVQFHLFDHVAVERRRRTRDLLSLQ